MLRTIFVGDLSYDSLRRERAAEIIRGCPQFGLEPVDLTIQVTRETPYVQPRREQSSWCLENTARRMAQWSGVAPRLIVGFDPLHAALAIHRFPGTPLALHIHGMGIGMPPQPMTRVSRQLPGLHEVLRGALHVASQVLVSHPRNAIALQQRWGVDLHRVHHVPLDVGAAGPMYLEANRVARSGVTTDFHWWLDLWHLNADVHERVASA